MSRTKAFVAAATAVSVLISSSALAAKTFEVNTSTFSKTYNANASVYYTENIDEKFDQQNFFMDELNVRKGDEVKVGDVLATFTRKSDLAGMKLIEIELDRTHEEYTKTSDKWRKSISDMQAEAAKMTDPVERKAALLEAELEESKFEQYCYNTENTISDLKTELEKAREEMETKELISDFDGTVTWVTYLKNGQQAYSWDTIMTLTNKDRMLLCVEDPQGNLRYGMKVDIVCGNKTQKTTQQELTGRVIVADNILKTKLKTGYSFIKLDEPLNDPDVRMIKVTAVTQYVEDVIVIPNNAITLDHGSMMVTLIDGEVEKGRYVNRVQFHGTDAWILQGLEIGQSILLK